MAKNLTGKKRRPVIDDGLSAVPPKKSTIRPDDSEETITFACNGGDGKRNKTADYITKCKRNEITPETIRWDREAYLKKHTKDDDQGNRESIANDESEIVEVLAPCRKRSGKYFFD